MPPSVTVILTARADKDVSNPRRGRKFKVAWRVASARTAVPYFRITKKAAKQTILLLHRHLRSPATRLSVVLLERERDKESVRVERKI